MPIEYNPSRGYDVDIGVSDNDSNYEESLNSGIVQFMESELKMKLKLVPEMELIALELKMVLESCE